MPTRKRSRTQKTKTAYTKPPLTTVEFTAAERTVSVVKQEQNLLDAAVEHRIPHMQECGGHGKCTTCRVRIVDGIDNVSPRNELETHLASCRAWDSSVRLACQTKVHGPVKVERLVKTFGDVSLLQGESLEQSGGKEQYLAILFCDMRNFTPFVESNLAFDVVHIINRLFAVLGEPILMNNGLIYQYVGDEIVGLFGLESQTAEESCMAALRAALGMRSALQQLNDELLSEFGIEIEIGVGIHFGPVIVGKMGHPSHRQFSIIGDAANVTSRIQAVNKTMRTQILASEALLDELPEETVSVGRFKRIPLKGKSHPVRIIEVIGLNQPDDIFLIQQSMPFLFAHESAFASEFYRRLFEKAPQARQLFKGNMERQVALLSHVLKGTVYALCRPQNLVMGLQELGKRHISYGVKKEHFALVKEVLLETLSSSIGRGYNELTHQAWDRVLDIAFQQMQVPMDKANSKD
ncbi:MAG: 2Fe-2S iron-sulfur cluster binding domain-containing protein [Cyanothece sp. SIO1E1]|nr:2Fe-2S iron-sulfur cluster binding domain-containing protein [Cyanothece sp. SIO1E1]